MDLGHRLNLHKEQVSVPVEQRVEVNHYANAFSAGIPNYLKGDVLKKSPALILKT